MNDSFPALAAEFYRLRDDRTNRYVAERSYQTTHCSVTVDEDYIRSYAAQTELLTVCNLLSRWCRRVTMAIPNVKVHPRFDRGSETLADMILSEMQDADPFGAFQVCNGVLPEIEVHLHVGPNPRPASDQFVTIASTGWAAVVSKDSPIALPDARDEFCLGALASACLGVAQVFKFALKMPANELLPDFAFDLFKMKVANELPTESIPPALMSPDVGRILMVGAGSVGSATAYCLRSLGVSGGLFIIDKDIVKIENFNRSPIFGRGNYGKPKAVSVADVLRDSKIAVDHFVGTWDEFIQKRSRLPNAHDVWLPLANEHGVRWSMQNAFPPLMIHASTGRNWGVNFGRHIPCEDDCIADRFPNVPDKSNFACSTATVQSQAENVDAALPFLSMLAGVFIVADLLRLQLAGYPQVDNYAAVDLGGAHLLRKYGTASRDLVAFALLSPRRSLGN